MFHSLSYNITFPKTGRTMQQTLDFQQGFSAIIGPNEVGKSMIFEMLRFSLFGTQALRGEAADYATLKVECEVTIRGERYRISRTMRRADIFRGTTLIATGVSPVNEKVGQLLGFGRTVFDVACAVNQGEIERLGAMTASERKRLVDSVLGIDALDVVAKWAMDEAKLLDRDAETLRGSQVEPHEPMPYTSYRPSAELREKVAGHHAEAMELSTLQGWLGSPGPGRPMKPTCSVNLPAANLMDLSAKRVVLRNEVETLRAKVQALPSEAPYDEAELESFDEHRGLYQSHLTASAYVKAHPAPRWLPQQLVIYKDDWTALENIERRAAIEVQLNVLLERGAKPCPHCAVDILCEHDEIQRLRQDLEAIVVPRDGYVPPRPPVPAPAIAHELSYAIAFDVRSFSEESKLLLEEPINKGKSEADVQNWRCMIDQVVQRAALSEKLDLSEHSLTAMPDYEAMYHQRLAYEQALQGYTQAEQMWMEHEATRAQKQVRANALAGSDAALRTAQDTLAVSVTYEAQLAQYVESKAAFDTMVTRVKGMTEDAVEHRKVRDAMNVLRTLIKQHILPSLNKVASHLLSGMTGGQRNIVCVDEDFNVLIDNQDIQTLSGSGKGVANLALRIALGQVLTNRVISVLFADEIDASMDEFRAEQTALVLRTMANSISQVLLISHKSLDADNIVDLGVSCDHATHNIGTAQPNP